MKDLLRSDIMRADMFCLIVKTFLDQSMNRNALQQWLGQHFGLNRNEQIAETERLLHALDATIASNIEPETADARRIGGFLWDFLLHFSLHLFSCDHDQALEAAICIRDVFGIWAGGKEQLEHHVEVWDQDQEKRFRQKEVAM